MLWRDETAVALNKPAGLPVHSTARHHLFTVVNYCKQHFTPSAPHPAHRIDMDTSGVLLCCFAPHGPHYKRAFFRRQVGKTYLAITNGEIEAPRLIIDAPLALDPGSDLGIRMAALPHGAPARTEIRVLARHDGYSLVEATPITGRQHQIRVHLASAGYPLIGDKLYGQTDEFFVAVAEGLLDADEIVERLHFPRHALHAFSLRIAHVSGKELRLIAPLPTDMLTFCSAHFPAQVLPAGAR